MPPMPIADQIVDLAFRIRARRVPSDHGYPLYAALCQALPDLHGAEWLGIHPIRGRKRVDGFIGVDAGCRLRLRLPIQNIGQVLGLAGRSIAVAANEITLGDPVVEQLAPSTSLDAKSVVVKVTRPPRSAEGHLDKRGLSQRVLAELDRQLARIGASAKVTITGRQQVSVDGRRVLGFSVRLTELDEESSLLVQRHGLGGKRRMGCGVFTATVAR